MGPYTPDNPVVCVGAHLMAVSREAPCISRVARHLLLKYLGTTTGLKPAGDDTCRGVSVVAGRGDRELKGLRRF